MKLSEKIQDILDSSITSYRIGKMAGVSDTSIGGMRRGERKVENMQLGIAEKLGAFYDKQMEDMSTEAIQIVLGTAFKKIGIKPFIDTTEMGDDEQDDVIIEIDVLDDDDPIRFVIYTNEIVSKEDVLENLSQAMRDFDNYEDGEGYYPDIYSDNSNNRQSVTAEYMAISKESSDYLSKLADKLDQEK